MFTNVSHESVKKLVMLLNILLTSLQHSKQEYRYVYFAAPVTIDVKAESLDSARVEDMVREYFLKADKVPYANFIYYQGISLLLKLQCLLVTWCTAD